MAQFKKMVVLSEEESKAYRRSAFYLNHLSSVLSISNQFLVSQRTGEVIEWKDFGEVISFLRSLINEEFEVVHKEKQKT